MAQRGFVRRVPASGKYRLGTKLVELGHRAGAADGLVESAGSYLTRLVAETGETAHLGVLLDGQVVSLCAVDSPKTLRTPATAGKRTPAHSSSLGKCILADLTSAELTASLARLSWERFTPRTIVFEEVLIKELETVRRQGFAVDNEEFEQGLKCVGAPVRDGTGRVRAALGIAGPRSRLGPQVMEHRAATVVALALGLSKKLGYKAAEASPPLRMRSVG